MQKKAKLSLILGSVTLALTSTFLFFKVSEKPSSLIAQADEILLDINTASNSQQINLVNQRPSPAAGIPSLKANAEAADIETDIADEYMNPIDRIRAIQNKTELHQALLEDNDQFKRYPEYNQAFAEPENDPILQRYEIDERSTLNEEDESSLTIWSDKKYYLHGDQATVFATLRDIEGHPISTQFIGQLIFNEQTSLSTMNFSDDNQDGIYELRIPLGSANDQTLSAGLYKVLIVNKTNKVADAITFILSKPEIELTGEYRDKLTEKGDMLVQAQVSVAAKNRYYFQASLYSANSTPVGATQTSLELSKGEHWIDLVFDKQLFKDAGESGAFHLRNLSLAKVTMPLQRAPMYKPDYFTKDYALNQFGSQQAANNDNLQANRLGE